jgi:hypothetical protein
MAYLRLGQIFSYIPGIDPAKYAGSIKRKKLRSTKPSHNRLRSMINRVRLLRKMKRKNCIKVTVFDRHTADAQKRGGAQKPVEVKNYKDYETDYHGLLLTAGIKGIAIHNLQLPLYKKAQTRSELSFNQIFQL